MDRRLRSLVEKVWIYHKLGHHLRKSDALLVLCSHDRIVAEHGAQLWLDGRAPLLIFSGGLGAITSRLWQEPEADQFAKIAVDMGVPRERIVIENLSTNTSRALTRSRSLRFRRPAHRAASLRHDRPGRRWQRVSDLRHIARLPGRRC